MGVYIAITQTLKMAKMMKSMAKSMKMRSMKAKKAMKSMRKMRRAMKKTAKSYKTSAGAKRAVFSGRIMKTKGGLAAAKKKLGKWNAAVKAARKALGIKGFQTVGGKS